MANNTPTGTTRKRILSSPRTVMALGIGILLIALSVRLGLVADTWQIVKQSFQRETVTAEITGPRHSHTPPQRSHYAPSTPGHVDRPPPPAPPDPVDAAEPFEIVESMPKMIGGLGDLQTRIHYPDIAKKAGIQGRVILQLLVEKDGTPTEIAVFRGIGGGCDEEAIRALGETRFTPGIHRGNPVRMKMSIPVVYRLK